MSAKRHPIEKRKIKLELTPDELKWAIKAVKFMRHEAEHPTLLKTLKRARKDKDHEES